MPFSLLCTSCVKVSYFLLLPFMCLHKDKDLLSWVVGVLLDDLAEDFISEHLLLLPQLERAERLVQTSNLSI